MVVAFYIAYCAVYAAAAYGLAHLVATVVERLTKRRPKLFIVPKQEEPQLEGDAWLRQLEQNAGIDVRALLRESRYVDPTPTADTLAAYDLFVRNEARLKRRRLRREARARAYARIKSFFTRKVS